MTEDILVVHASVDEALAHYGIPGMKWGYRRTDAELSALNVKPKGVTIRPDGSIEIEKGASLQRLVRSNGKSLPMKDLTYASLTEYDNAKYIKVIGGKGFFGGGRDQILSLQATQKISAPSKEEATRMVSDLLLNDPQFRKKNTNMLDVAIGAKELKQIAADPVGKTAQAWYEMTNQKLTFDAEFDEHAPYVQSVMRKTVESKGYNALRDENDVNAGLAKAPIIIFNPSSSLKVKTITDITDDIRRANKETLKQYRKRGKDWAEKELYS